MELAGEVETQRGTKRAMPNDYHGPPRKSRRYEREDTFDRSGRRDREMGEMHSQIEQTREYAQRQKVKKSTIKRQAMVMAEALGRSEKNVQVLARYISKITHQRM